MPRPDGAQAERRGRAQLRSGLTDLLRRVARTSALSRRPLPHYAAGRVLQPSPSDKALAQWHRIGTEERRGRAGPRASARGAQASSGLAAPLRPAATLRSCSPSVRTPAVPLTRPSGCCKCTARCLASHGKLCSDRPRCRTELGLAGVFCSMPLRAAHARSWRMHSRRGCNASSPAQPFRRIRHCCIELGSARGSAHNCC